MAWSNLPTDLLHIIARTLTELSDQIRFSCVCSHWRSAFRSSPPLSPQLPWLLLSSSSNSTNNTFYSLSEDRVYPLPLSVARSTFLSGSSSGWLLALQGQTRNFTYSIMNPFTGASIRLPCPKPECPLFDLTPDRLVWDCSDSVVVAACLGKRGVFYSHLDNGKQAWEQIECMQNVSVKSITCYKSRFYIHVVGEIIVLKDDTLEEILAINTPNRNGTHLFVSSEESLHLLNPGQWAQINYYEYSYTYPNIDQLDLKELEWKRVYDIGDRAIFTDDVHCFSVEVDARNNLTRNCTYRIVSDLRADPRGRLSDIYALEVFDLGNKRIRRVDLSKFGDALPCGKFRPPTWILPSLH